MFSNPLSQYEKSHHTPGEEFVDGQVVDEHGEEMVNHLGRWWTESDWDKEVQGRQECTATHKAERQAVYNRLVHEREAEEARYREYESRREGFTSGGDNAYKWGTVRDEGIPGGGVMAVLLLVLLGGGALVAALASVIR